MKNIKKRIFVVNSFVLISLYAAEQKIVDLKNIINPQEVSAKFVDAWNFAQKSVDDANFLELASKIKKIQACADCTMAEKRLFITLLNNPNINLFDYKNMVVIFVDDLKKYQGLKQTCDAGSVTFIKKCEVNLTKAVLRRMRDEAIKNNRKGLMELLIDAGVNLQGISGSDFSPLMEAIKNNSPEIVQMLIDKGADVNFKAYNGNTALKIAEQKGDKEIIEMLKKAGAVK